MAFPAHEIQLKWKKDVGRGGGIPQMLEKTHNSYFGAVFQCLCHTPPLANFFFAQEHSKNCEKNQRTCLMCSLEKLVCDLFEFGRRAVCPRFMINNMCRIQNAFNLFEEQDIHLVLLFLLEGLHNSCLHGHKDDEPGVKSTIISETFGGNMFSQSICLCCKKVAHLYEEFQEIELDIKDVNNVKSALQHFFSREAEAKSNMECKRCFRTLYYKTHSIHDPPNVLTLVLDRFDESCEEKIEKKVKFPRMLNLKPFLTHPYKGNLTYNLYAIIVHTGKDCNKGSYHCYVKASDTYWYRKKNEVVEETLLWAVLKQKAYILFYIRCHKSSNQKILRLMEVAASESNVSHKVSQWSPPTCRQYLCCFNKGPKGYGFTLCKNRDKPGLYVINVKKGLPAEKAGLWNGAYIIEVNGINAKGKSIEDVGQMIATSDPTRLLVVFKDTYLCHTMCKFPRTTVHLKDPLLQPLSKATTVNKKLEKSENITKSASVKDFQAHDLERKKIIAGYDDPRLEEQDEPSATKGANDIVIHCDGIDGEEQKLLFEGILQHSVELFTLKRNTMLLTCQTAEEVDRILATGEFKIDGKELHVEAWNESSFEVDAYHMKLEGLDENTPLKLVSSFIELNSGRCHLDFNVDYAKDGRVAIVTFRKPIAWKVFQKACSTCKLYGRAILATPLQMTKWLCVEGFPSSTNMITLHQYFQKEAEICGGNISSMSMEEHKQMAYLQFDSSEGAKQVLAKQRCLRQTSTQTFEYNNEDDIVVRGLKVAAEMPKKETCHIDHNILKLIVKNPFFTKYIKSKFKSISAELQFHQSTSSVVVIPRFKIEAMSSLNLVQHWKIAVHKMFEETMNNFGGKTFAVTHPEVWNRVQNEMTQLMTNARIINFDHSSLNIHLFAEVKDLKITGKTIEKAVEKAHKDIKVDPHFINKIIPLKFSEFELLKKLKVEVNMKNDFPFVVLELLGETNSLSFEGMKIYFKGVRNKVKKSIRTFTQKKISLTSEVIQFLQNAEIQQAINERFEENSITALIICSKQVYLHSTKDCLQIAETFLKQFLSIRKVLFPKYERRCAEEHISVIAGNLKDSKERREERSGKNMEHRMENENQEKQGPGKRK